MKRAVELRQTRTILGTQGTDFGKTTPSLPQPVAVCPKIVSRRVNRPIVLTNLVAVWTNLVAVWTNLVAAFTNLTVILTNPVAVFPKIVTILTQRGTI